MVTRRNARRAPGANESNKDDPAGEAPVGVMRSPVNNQPVPPAANAQRSPRVVRSPPVIRSPPANYNNQFAPQPIPPPPPGVDGLGQIVNIMQAMQNNQERFLQNLMQAQQQNNEQLLRRFDVYQHHNRDVHGARGQQPPAHAANSINAQPNAVGGRNQVNNANAQHNNGNGNPRTQHLKTTHAKIPQYCGSADYKTPYDFLIELEKYREVIGYTETDMVQLVIPLSLTGDAYNWYRYFDTLMA